MRPKKPLDKPGYRVAYLEIRKRCVKGSTQREMRKNSGEIVVYLCRNLRLFENGEQKAYARSHPGVKFVAIPCSGKMEASYLLKTLADGAEGVLVLGCATDACHFLEGSMRSHKRLDYARTWLEELGIEPERVEFVFAKPMDQSALDELIKDFSQKLETFGKIPAKESA